MPILENLVQFSNSLIKLKLKLIILIYQLINYQYPYTLRKEFKNQLKNKCAFQKGFSIFQLNLENYVSKFKGQVEDSMGDLFQNAKISNMIEMEDKESHDR